MKGRRGTKRKAAKQGPVSSTGDPVSAPVCLPARKKSTLETGRQDNMLCTEEPRTPERRRVSKRIAGVRESPRLKQRRQPKQKHMNRNKYCHLTRENDKQDLSDIQEELNPEISNRNARSGEKATNSTNFSSGAMNYLAQPTIIRECLRMQDVEKEQLEMKQICQGRIHLHENCARTEGQEPCHASKGAPSVAILHPKVIQK